MGSLLSNLANWLGMLAGWCIDQVVSIVNAVVAWFLTALGGVTEFLAREIWFAIQYVYNFVLNTAQALTLAMLQALPADAGPEIAVIQQFLVALNHWIPLGPIFALVTLLWGVQFGIVVFKVTLKCIPFMG